MQYTWLKKNIDYQSNIHWLQQSLQYYKNACITKTFPIEKFSILSNKTLVKLCEKKGIPLIRNNNTKSNRHFKKEK